MPGKELPPKQRLVVDLLPSMNWNYSEALRKVYGSKRCESYLHKLRKNPLFVAAIEEKKAEILRSTEWTFESSKRFSLKMISLCEQKISESPENAAVWVKRLEFWKENLDKLHAMLTNVTKSEAEVRVKELQDLSPEDIAKLASMKVS